MKWTFLLSMVLLAATLNAAAQGKAGKSGPPSTPGGGHRKVQASPHKSTNPKGKGRTAGLRKGTKKGLKKQNPVRKGRTKATARTRRSASFRSGEEDRA